MLNSSYYFCPQGLVTNSGQKRTLWPLKLEDMDSPEYEEGVCCPRCAADLSDSLRASRRERQRQQTLARTRGDKHIGQQFEVADDDS